MKIILAPIVIIVVFSVIRWCSLLFSQSRRDTVFSEFYSTRSLFIVTLNIGTVFYAAILGLLARDGLMIFTIIFAAISPPAMMIFGMYILYSVHFVAFAVTILLLILLCYVALQKTAGPTRLIVAVLAIIPICIIPLSVQGMFSIASIKSHYARMGGECLSHGSFVQSLKNGTRFTYEFHAVAVKGETAYIWSYSQYAFVDSEMGLSGTLAYAPNSDCDVYGRSHE